MSWIGILQYVGTQSRLINAKQLPPLPPKHGNYLLAKLSAANPNPMGAATTFLKNNGFVHNQAIVIDGFESGGKITFNDAHLPLQPFDATSLVASVNEFMNSLSPAGMLIEDNSATTEDTTE